MKSLEILERLKREVRDAFERDNFADFSERISRSRNMVQNMVGCDMRTIEKAAYDPVPYLLNTFIDYLWAYWQELQRLRGKTEKYAEKYETLWPPLMTLTSIKMKRL